MSGRPLRARIATRFVAAAMALAAKEVRAQNLVAASAENSAPAAGLPARPSNSPPLAMASTSTSPASSTSDDASDSPSPASPPSAASSSTSDDASASPSPTSPPSATSEPLDAPRPPPPLVPDAAPPLARRRGDPAALRFDGGYAIRRLFDLGVSGADLGLAYGTQPRQHVAWWLTGRASVGSTDNDLTAWSGRLGVEIEGVFDPVRFGVGASVIMIGVARATRSETLRAYGVEGRAFGRVDALRTDDFALFLRVGLDAAVETSTGHAFWGPGIGLGFELGVAGKRPPTWSQAARPSTL